MLNRKERIVFCTVYSVCNENGSCLLSPEDVVKLCHYKGITKDNVSGILEDISSQGYFDVINSDRHGETVYCIILTAKGTTFSNERKAFKKMLLTRLFLTIGFAILSFLIGVILRRIFT